MSLANGKKICHLAAIFAVVGKHGFLSLPWGLFEKYRTMRGWRVSGNNNAPSTHPGAINDSGFLLQNRETSSTSTALEYYCFETLLDFSSDERRI
jgi:hypothetical protein